MIDNVWLTFKVRAYAEGELRWLSSRLNLLVTWLSFNLLAVSILSVDPFFKIINNQYLMLVLGLFTFSSSVVVYGLKLEERAQMMRRSYTRLQNLYNRIKISGCTDLSHVEEYHEIIEETENHSEFHYIGFMVWRIWFASEKITVDGEVKNIGKISGGNYLISFFIVRLVIYGMYLSPIILYGYLIW